MSWTTTLYGVCTKKSLHGVAHWICDSWKIFLNIIKFCMWNKIYLHSKFLCCFCINAVHYSTDVSYGATFLTICSSYNFSIRLPVILLENTEQERYWWIYCSNSALKNNQGCTSTNRLYKTGHTNSVHQHPTRFLKTKDISNLGTLFLNEAHDVISQL
jgi:hypothetical protein